MIVCLEGIDAVGKNTQAKLLAERLPAKVFPFPNYDTPAGHIILGHLKRYWSAAPAQDLPPDVDPPRTDLLNAMVFQALQTVNRLECVQAIQEADRAGHVVFDRYWPSGVVYGGADGLDTHYLRELHASLIQPDLYVLLDMPPALSAERRPERRDRYEQQEGLMEEAAHRYRGLWHHQAKSEGAHRWVQVDASQSITEVHRAIMAAVSVRSRELINART